MLHIWKTKCTVLIDRDWDEYEVERGGGGEDLGVGVRLVSDASHLPHLIYGGTHACPFSFFLFRYPDPGRLFVL